MVLLQLHPNYDNPIEHEVPFLTDKIEIIMRERREEVERAERKRKAEEETTVVEEPAS